MTNVEFIWKNVTINGEQVKVKFLVCDGVEYCTDEYIGKDGNSCSFVGFGGVDNNWLQLEYPKCINKIYANQKHYNIVNGVKCRTCRQALQTLGDDLLYTESLYRDGAYWSINGWIRYKL